MSRTRRQTRAPKKLEQEADEPAQNEAQAALVQATRQVYKVLRRKDVRRQLKDQDIYILWPSDRVWYRGQIEQLRIKSMSASIHYPDTDEYEDIDLEELIRDKCIAIKVERERSAKLRKLLDVPVSTEDLDGAEFTDDPGSGDEFDANGADYRDDEDEDAASVSSDDEPLAKLGTRHQQQLEQAAAPARPQQQQEQPQQQGEDSDEFGSEDSELRAARRAGLRAAQRRRVSGRPMAHPVHAARADDLPSSSGDEGSSDRRRGAAKRRGSSAALPPVKRRHSEAESAGAPTPTGSAVDDFSRSVLQRILQRQGSESSQGARRGPPARSGFSQQRMQRLSSTGSAGGRGADDEVRHKACEQLVVGLAKALEEMRAEGHAGVGLPEPAALAKDVEEALYRLCGAITSDYKNKLRSLIFNLKDPANPQLRARVLSGELQPGTLVLLGPDELASRELSSWRKEREEAHSKEIVLDVETAAKFSTAAAWALRGEVTKQRAATPPPPLDAAAAAAAAPDGADADMANGEEHEHEGQQQQELEDGGEDAMEWDAGRHQLGEDGGPQYDPEHAHDEEEPTTPLHAQSPDGAGAAVEIEEMSYDAGLDFPADDTGHASPGQPVEAAGRTSTETGTGQQPDAARQPGTAAAAAPPATATKLAAPAAGASPHAAAPKPKFAGIDWAAIKNEALKNLPTPKGDDGALGKRDSLEHGATNGSEAVHDEGDDVADGVPDLAPVVPAAAAGPCPQPCSQVWQGTLAMSGAGSIAATVSYLGGSSGLGVMLGPAGSEVPVIGRVPLDKFSQFIEDLRHSRSRTVALGVLVAADDDVEAVKHLRELVHGYSGKERVGKLGLDATPGLEGYLVARSELTARLVKTARLVARPEHMHLMPADVAADSELLLVVVHRKDWQPPPGAVMPQAEQQQQQQQEHVTPPPPPPPVQQQASTHPQAQPLQRLVSQACASTPPHSPAGVPVDPRKRRQFGMQPQQQQQLPQQPQPQVPPPQQQQQQQQAAQRQEQQPTQQQARPAQSVFQPPSTSGAAPAAPQAPVLPPGLNLQSLASLAAVLGLPGAKGPAGAAPAASAPPAPAASGPLQLPQQPWASQPMQQTAPPAEQQQQQQQAPPAAAPPFAGMPGGTGGLLQALQALAQPPQQQQQQQQQRPDLIPGVPPPPLMHHAPGTSSADGSSRRRNRWDAEGDQPGQQQPQQELSGVSGGMAPPGLAAMGLSQQPLDLTALLQQVQAAPPQQQQQMVVDLRSLGAKPLGGGAPLSHEAQQQLASALGVILPGSGAPPPDASAPQLMMQLGGGPGQLLLQPPPPQQQQLPQQPGLLPFMGPGGHQGQLPHGQPPPPPHPMGMPAMHQGMGMGPPPPPPPPGMGTGGPGPHALSGPPPPPPGMSAAGPHAMHRPPGDGPQYGGYDEYQQGGRGEYGRGEFGRGRGRGEFRGRGRRGRGPGEFRGRGRGRF